ncbi:Aminotransferase-like plant mobile domain family protein [Euphorbia peplus]|nr:Aminotransferase-like plant mobile domain family protein [Euphorbia peplus]
MENSPPNSYIFESREELMISSSDDHGNSKPFSRTAHFLQPCISELSSSLSLPTLPPTFDPKRWHFTLNFHGWKNPSKNWKEWVQKMASLHATTWKKAGIYDAILFSTYDIKKLEGSSLENTSLILGVAERWSPQTNTFIFPWGEATITLEDMLIAGYSVLGSPVFEPLETEESKVVQEALELERKKVIRTRVNKASQGKWLKVFKDSASEIEHEAFLSFWISRFVLPTARDIIHGCVFPIAIHLARGTRIALAPAVLASIYRDLTLLKQKIVSLTTLDADNDENLVVTTFAPFQLVLVWVWERFLKLSPKPNLLKIGEPRFSRWNIGVNGRCNAKTVRSLLESSGESFNWRPYTRPLENWDFPKFYRENEMWVFCDSELDDELLSFILCLRVSELVGTELKCREQYLPHRVARQFGFDQDIPGFVVETSASSKHAWSCYIRPVGDAKCYIPSRLFEKDVTKRYLDWWNTLELKEKKKPAAHLNTTKKDDIHMSFIEPIVDHSKTHANISKARIEEINSLSVPPGFPPEEEEEDSTDEDNLTIAEILKLKPNRDANSKRKRDNWNNFSSTPESHSSPIATKTPAVAALVENNDHYNLVPSQSRPHSCSGAVNGAEVAGNGEDVNLQNLRVQLGESQTHSSSVPCNDQTPNYLDLQEATMAENVKEDDVEYAHEGVRTSLATRGQKNILTDAMLMGLKRRVERLVKINEARKALLYKRYSGRKREEGNGFDQLKL